MDETTISQVNPQASFVASPQPSSLGPKKFILPIIIVLILLGVIGGGAKLLQSRGENIPTPTPFPTAEPTQSPTPTAEVSSTPTSKPKATPTKKPTPTKEATSSATSKGLIVRVLNGSGIAGRAANLIEYLEGLGYESGGTGNADNPDYEKTTITIKKIKESLLPTLKSDVVTKYQVGSTSADLSSTESYDAVVIIGKQQP